ncbi:MAG: ribonuclease P protein component [bacterium]|nr:ribonuclease P protein component [bacterium]
MGKSNGALDREIRRLLREGRIYRGRWVHVRAIPSDQTRTIITVRRKFGNAVRRNLVRRRIREICREAGPGWFSGYLVMISVGDGSSGAPFGALHADVAGALRVLGFLDA